MIDRAEYRRWTDVFGAHVMSIESLEALDDVVARCRPGWTIEFGSGFSTVVLARGVARYGGRLVTVNQEGPWHAEFVRMLNAAGAPPVEICVFPLAEDGWYAIPAGWEHRRKYDLVLVDGPDGPRRHTETSLRHVSGFAACGAVLVQDDSVKKPRGDMPGWKWGDRLAGSLGAYKRRDIRDGLFPKRVTAFFEPGGGEPLRTDLAFCVPTVLRPEILESVLRSVVRYVAELKPFKVYAHVDCAPPSSSVKPEDVLAVLSKFFGCVISRIDSPPLGYAPSAHWLLKTSTEPLIFYLEDDWEVRRPSPLDRMLEYFKSSSALQLRLRRNGVHNEPIVCTSPGIWRRKLCDLVAREMSDDVDFESQLKQIVERVYGTRRLAAVYPHSKNDAVVDIGRAWRRERGIFKPNELGEPKRNFVRWVYR